MIWFLRQLPSVLLCVWGVIVFILAGNKVRFGWLLGIASEAAWAVYAVWIRQWGLLLGCLFYAVVYLRNYVKWKHEDA